MKDLKKKFLRLFKNNWPLLLITLIVSLFFWKVFIKGFIPIPGDFVVGVYYPWLDYKWGFEVGVPVKNPITTDVVSLLFPEQILGIEQIKSGQWPLWNPYILAGTPLLANLQTGSFSLTSFLYYLLDVPEAWSFQIILSHILVVIFTYLLLRHWGVFKLASVFGGVVFSFSGFNLIFSQWNGHTLTSAFIPLVLLFEDRLMTKGGILNGIGLSLAIGFQFFSGYPQTSLYTFLAMFILWIFRFSNYKDFFIRGMMIGVFSFLGMALASLLLFPAKELWTLSQRNYEPHPYEWAFLPYKKIITFIAADFFGNHATKNYWGPQDYTSNSAYIGVVAFVLAWIPLFWARKRREIMFLLSIAALSLILSFATPVSIFLWEKNILGMRAASAHRATILFTFSVSLLAAFGLDYLKRIKKRIILVAILALVFLILVAFFVYAVSKNGIVVGDTSVMKVALRNLILPSTVFILSALIILVIPKFKNFLILLSIFELFYFGWKFTPFSPKQLIFPTTPVLDFLTSQKKPYRVTGNKVIPVNMRTPYRLESLEGYETIHPLRISQFLAALNSGRSGTNPVGRYGTVDNDTSRLLDLVNTKYYLTHKLDKKRNPSPEGKIDNRFESERFKIVFEDRSVAVLESKSVLPRSFFVGEWEIVKDDREILEKMLNPDFEFAKRIILEEEPPKDIHGFIFTSDSWYPGWKAKVDGKETKIYRADFAFRAVPVPSKESKVEYTYRPESFLKGLKISFVSALTLLGLFILKKVILGGRE